MTARWLCALLLLSASASAHVVPLTAPRLVEASDRIVVAVVEEAAGRWAGHLIHTDYVLRIEDRLRDEAPERVTVSLPGGTIGNETHGTCLSLPLERGERYLLFMDRQGDVVGGWQGAVPEAAGFARFAGMVEDVRAFLAGEERDLRAMTEAVTEAAEAGLRPAWEPFLIGTPAIPPIVFNPLPASSPFSPHDRSQMAYWNIYAPNLFVSLAPSSSDTWSFGNGVFDIAGFPDDARMQKEFGRPWSPGALSQASFRIVDEHIVEADIALNPAFAWTLDEDKATRPNGPHSFRRSILSHLGVAWGLRPSFSLAPRDRESIVGSVSPPYNLATLFSDDTAAVREAFGIGAFLRDGLISPYSLQPAPARPRQIPVRAVPASVPAGGSFRVSSPVKIENVGTESLARPQVDLYLVPRRFSMEGAVFLKRVRLQGAIPAGALRNVNLGQARVPGSVPPGVYYLAFQLKASGDRQRVNDFAWSDPNVTLTVR
ncbi:MAG TPA: hypothetical protein VN493_08535 [Thermoanaerobaculia bacterium]|nr:hypothetical protein [Thermoanaerobaculia bacterium]